MQTGNNILADKQGGFNFIWRVGFLDLTRVLNVNLKSYLEEI